MDTNCTTSKKQHELMKKREQRTNTFMAPQTIGERIRWERQKLGLTQKQLSEKLDISPSYLGALERGSRPISASISARIHNFLNISYDYLLEGEGLPPPMYPQAVYESTTKDFYEELLHILKTCTTVELEACCALVKTHLMSMRRQQFALHKEHQESLHQLSSMTQSTKK